MRLDFPVEATSFNNSLVYSYESFQLIWSPEPKVELNKEILKTRDVPMETDLQPVFYLCRSAPAVVLLPVRITQGIAFLHEIFLDGRKVQGFDPPLVLDSERNPVHDLELDLDKDEETRELINMIGPDGKKMELCLRCFGLADPFRFPLVFHHIESPELLLRVDRWTEQGYTPECDIDQKEGLVFRVSPHIHLERFLVVDVRSESSPRRQNASMKIFNINAGDARIRITPGGAFVIPFSKKRLIELTSSPKTNIVTTLDFEVFSRDSGRGTKKIVVPFRIDPIHGASYPHFIGVDFGTSNSCVALSLPYQKDDKWYSEPISSIVNLALDRYCAEPLPDRDPEIVPTVLNGSPTSYNRRIGYMATMDGNAKLKREFKREIARDGGDIEPVKAFLQELISRIHLFLLDKGSDRYQASRIVMTVPTAFSPAQKTKLKGCCEEALRNLGIGKPDVRLIDESLAAMSHFLGDTEVADEMKDAPLLMVIDMGGGTTDITIVQRIEKRYSPIIVGGDSEFGGKEATEWLKEILDVEHTETAEDAKRHLSTDKRWDEWIKSSDIAQPRSYEEVVAELKRRLQTELKRILLDVISDLAGTYSLHCSQGMNEGLIVLLAGGASELIGYDEVVRATLKELIDEYGLSEKMLLKAIYRDKYPKKCVSRGAFFYENGVHIDLTHDHNVSPLRVLWPVVYPNALGKGVKLTWAKVSSPKQKGTTVYNLNTFAVLVDRNLPLPTPDDKRRIWNPIRDFGITKREFEPQFYIQAGSSPVRPCEPSKENGIPEVMKSDMLFQAYLDENGNERIKVLG